MIDMNAVRVIPFCGKIEEWPFFEQQIPSQRQALWLQGFIVRRVVNS
jgi:hypothetical protein